MSIILGALGGLGEAGMQMAQNNQKAWADQELEAQRQELATQKAMALETFKNNLAVETANAPLNRLTVKAKEYANTEVSDAPKPENKWNDYGPGESPVNAGIVTEAQMNPKRKLSSREALQAAVDDAMVNDIPAYAAYQEKVGKPEREERKLDLAEAISTTKAAAKDAADERKDARERYVADLRHKDSMARLEALVAKTGGKDGSGKEALSVIDGTRKALTAEMTDARQTFSAELKNAPTRAASEEVKKKWQPIFDEFKVKSKQLDADFSFMRNKLGMPPIVPQEPEPKPAAAPVGNDPLGLFKKK